VQTDFATKMCLNARIRENTVGALGPKDLEACKRILPQNFATKMCLNARIRENTVGALGPKDLERANGFCHKNARIRENTVGAIGPKDPASFLTELPTLHELHDLKAVDF